MGTLNLFNRSPVSSFVLFLVPILTVLEYQSNLWDWNKAINRLLILLPCGSKLDQQKWLYYRVHSLKSIKNSLVQALFSCYKTTYLWFMFRYNIVLKDHYISRSNVQLGISLNFLIEFSDINWIVKALVTYNNHFRSFPVTLSDSQTC